MLFAVYRPFHESEEVSEERRMKLLGLILSCLANYREQVRQEALLVIGQHIFGSPDPCGAGQEQNVLPLRKETPVPVK